MEQVKQFLMNAWEWLNAPLPIVGVSVLIIMTFLWKLFASSSFGKRAIAKINEGFERTQNELNEKIAEYEEKLEQTESKMQELEFLIEEFMSLIPNKKVQALKEKVYGGEKETDNQTEKE